ncbi:MAG: nuclear transport factor 2 family protein [Phycisphaerales bacterium]|nr:nuclear transport factor 2 family protein [Phycisphaerales bacterium]
MRRFAPSAFVSAAAVFMVGCATSSDRRTNDGASSASMAHAAHEAYVNAINSNNLDAVLAMLTDDVVFMAPHEPRLVGKAAVRPWAEGYLGAFRIHWEKTTLEFVVSGEWAFEQYAYKCTDTPRSGGPAVHDSGKGINIYHRDPDGTWRVARDAWSSDLPATTK